MVNCEEQKESVMYSAIGALGLFLALAALCFKLTSWFYRNKTYTLQAEKERLEDENKTLRNKIEKHNNRPITDSDVDGVFAEAIAAAKARESKEKL